MAEPEMLTARGALSVVWAAQFGTARDLLVATRDRIAVDVENPETPSRDLAALTRRLLEITKEIEAIDAREDGPGDGEEATDGEFDAASI